MTTTFVPDKLVKPGRPWRRTHRSTLAKLGFVVIAGLSSTGIVAVTGLAGPLGWYVGFVFSLAVLGFLGSFFRDRVVAIDLFATVLICTAFMTVLIPWASIFYSVIKRGAPAFHRGYLTTDMLVTSSGEALNLGGLSHAIVGTLLMLTIAALICIPLGIIAAIYIVEIKGRFAGIVRFLTQAMSGVPSIVAGLFIYSTLVILVFHSFSGIAGSCALAILMLPTVTRTAEEVLKLVPDHLRAASYALGASQAQTTFKVVLPSVRSGLISASVLGLARVAGETAPLLLTSGYFIKLTTNVGNGAIGSLPTYIFSALGAGTTESMTRAWGGACVLLILILILFIGARSLGGRNKGR